MKNLITYSILLFTILTSCNQDELKYCELELQKKQTQLEENAIEMELLRIDGRKLKEIYDSLVIDLKSCEYDYNYLSESWTILVEDYNSLLKAPPDTFIFIPQCTLFYERIDSINGVQFYVGYDSVYYKLYQDHDTIQQTFYEFERDTIIKKYRFVDSTIYIDSIIKDATGKLVLWAHTLCDKYMSDSCESRLVLGHVLTGSGNETEGISFFQMDALSWNEDDLTFPKIKIIVNDKDSYWPDQDDDGYSSAIYLGWDEIKTIEITFPENEEDEIFVRDIYLNRKKLNHPEGWNVAVDDSIEWLGNTYFLMLPNGKLRLEKP